MKVLVTGTAGFIGHFVAQRLIARGDEVLSVDSINDYYDPTLKMGRLAVAGFGDEVAQWGRTCTSRADANHRFVRLDLADRDGVAAVFRTFRPEGVIHLAAQAGVRYSLTHPHAYIDANIHGTLNILEGCRHQEAQHLVFASSSSVYGLNTVMPFSTGQSVDHPVSLYAATKKSNELMAHSYSHLYALPTTGLRFFTVYGPWGRPDMALFLFTKAILEGRPIEVFNHGEMRRDFTYVDDIVEGVIRVLDSPPQPNSEWAGEPNRSSAPFRIYNIGNASPVALGDFIAAIETSLGRVAEKVYLPIQPGDVPATWADVSDLEADVGYAPATPVAEGVARFVAWYKGFYLS